jgi:plasmid stabilization system protein ParE
VAFQYKLHPEAQKEYESSVSWYLERSLKAAKDFVHAVDTGLVEICNNPNRYRNEYKNYRELSIRKYPLLLFM